jgi:hypothetical protein
VKKRLALSVHSLAALGAHAKDIVDTAVSAGSFNTLVAAVKAAGLVETLKGPGARSPSSRRPSRRSRRSRRPTSTRCWPTRPG